MVENDAVALWIELSESCQLKCRYCYNGWRNQPARTHRLMPDEVIERVLTYARGISRSRTVSFALAGGDPSTHPALVRIAARLAALGPVTIVSHGLTFSWDELDAFAAIDGLSLQFSIPTPDKEVYRHITVGGDVDDALLRLAYARQAGIAVSMSAVLTRINIEHLPQILQLATFAEVEYLILNQFLPSGRGIFFEQQFTISDQAFQQAVAASIEHARETGLRVLTSGPLEGVRERRLQAPRLTLTVDGGVRMCSVSEQQAGTLDTPVDQLLHTYRRFWGSDEALSGCHCSASKAPGDTVTPGVAVSE